MAKRRQKGTGSVWQDPNTKKWKGQIQVGFLPNGKKKLKTVTGKTSKEVKYKLERIKASVLTDNYISDSKITIPQLATQINDEKYNLNLIKTGTYNRNIQTINVIKKSPLINVPIQKITESLLREFYLNNTDYATSVIKKLYEQINLTLNKAVQQGIITKNINANIPRPNSNKQTKKVSALTLEQQEAVTDALIKDNKEPYKTMLLLSLYTGMRMGEIGALPIYNIDLDNNTIKIERTLTRNEKEQFIIGETAKTSAGIRIIKIIPYVSQMLKKYINESYTTNPDSLIFTKKNKLIGVTQVNSYYKRLIIRYGISDTDVGFNQHQLRHTYATRSIESGMSAKVLQKKMGHTDIKVTMNTYADVFAQFEDAEDNKYLDYLQKSNLLK